MTDFKPGDKVRVTIDCEIDGRGLLEPTNSKYSYLPGFTEGDALRPADAEKLFGAVITPLPANSELPAPYTEPREGDLVEVQQQPTRGRYRSHGGRHWVETDDGPNIGPTELNTALAEGRVRLVEAAAPRYEPGRIYSSDESDALWFYAGPGSDHRWRLLYPDGDVCVTDEPPADLVPCDVVPRTES